MRTLSISAAALLALTAPSVLAQDTSSRADIAPVKADPTPPPIFAKLSFDDALAKAKSEHKLLIIKFTAEWCGPCKQMDKTTWRDQSVIDWAADHAVIIAVDVDKDEKISRDHKIKAMPTMVAYRDGVEFDRTVGYMNGAKTLSWMKDVNDGKSKADAARKRAKSNNSKSVNQRMEDASTLIEAGDFATASPMLIDLWQHMAEAEPEMAGVRVSFFVDSVEQACAEHAPTRKAFIKIRDEDEAKLKASPDYDTLTDWIILNKAVAQPEKTLEWFDRVKATDNGRVTARRVLAYIEPLIKERGDLRDISIVTPDPLRTLRAKITQTQSMQTMLAQNPEFSHMGPELWTSARTELATLHAALILDSRADDAAAFRTQAIDLDNTLAMRIALIEAAIQHIPDRPATRLWALPMLDQVDSALKSKPDADISFRAAGARKTLSK